MSAALVALAAAALPALVDARYRVEIAGEPVGWAHLRARCAAAACEATWQSRLRAPEEAGAGTIGRSIEIASGPDGAARSVRVRVTADGRERRLEAGPGPAPATFAELLLSEAAPGERRCLAVRDEESGRVGEACARREGAWLNGAVLGEPIRFRAAPRAAPDEVVLPAQRARFVADARAALPARAPRLDGAAVEAEPGAVEAPGWWCGRPPDPEPPRPPPPLPRRFPGGASCRERTARYLALAARAGFEGRVAVGVAFDGERFAWHAWAELRDGDRWIAVDPSFGQLPARGPRFTLARYAELDARARAEAGRAVLDCWGRGRVERAGPGPPGRRGG